MAAEVIEKKFASPIEFLEWATNEPTPWRGRLSSRETDDRNWYGTRNYEEAYDLARHGWQKGLDQLVQQVDIAARISPQTPLKKRKYDVAGIRPHPGRAAAGEPFAMAAGGKNFKQKPIIKIRTNYVFAAMVDSKDVMRWGAAVCSYIDFLGRAGFSVQLDNFMELPHDRYKGGPHLSFQFPLKKAGQPLSLASLVFWWSHPSAFRRIGFSAVERLDIEQYYRGSYGGPVVPVPIIIKPDPDVLLLTVDDVRPTMQQCLEVIKSRHAQLIKNSPNPWIMGELSGPKI